jgi:hypothetical protein
MKRLGVSIYPEHDHPERIKTYLEKASRLGYKRVFTCLLSAEGEPNHVKATFQDICGFAKQCGMEVIIDVSPSVFARYGITYDNLSFFSEIHVDGIRLDEGFDGLKESVMTYNPYGLKIEFNASQPSGYLDNVLSYQPNRDRMIVCHNFYPQRYTGLSYRLFKNLNQRFRSHNLNTAAFINSKEKDTFGPWPIKEGLCTLEMHRDLPLSLQARHLHASGLIDDVIIGNCYASDEELLELSQLNPNILTFKIIPESGLSSVERAIVFEFPHVVRGDMSDYMARSTMSRIVYGKESIPAHNTRDLKRGDIVVLNDQYGRYKGELHIVLQPMINDGNKNVVGTLALHEAELLEFIEPWKSFKLIE